jgi:hypothetical protein
LNAPIQPALFDRWGRPAAHVDPQPSPAPPETQRTRPAPLASNSDPISSHIAAERVRTSSRQGSLKRRALEVVRANPNHTFHELARLLGEEAHAVEKRLGELKTEGLIEHGPMRRDSISGGPCHEWRLRDGTAPRSDARTQVISRETTAIGSASAPEPTPAPATCTRCGSSGRRKVSTDPTVYSFCDELFGRTCRFAERRRRINGSPNYELSPAELEALTQ